MVSLVNILAALVYESIFDRLSNALFDIGLMCIEVKHHFQESLFHHRSQSDIFTVLRLHFVSGKMVRVWYITSCWKQVNLLLAMPTDEMCLKRAIQENRPEWVNRQQLNNSNDNVRSLLLKPTYKRRIGNSYPTRRYHQTYLLQITTSRSMELALADKQFSSSETIENWLSYWVTSKEVDFFKEGIRKSPERCLFRK